MAPPVSLTLPSWETPFHNTLSTIKILLPITETKTMLWQCHCNEQVKIHPITFPFCFSQPLWGFFSLANIWLSWKRVIPSVRGTPSSRAERVLRTQKLPSSQLLGDADGPLPGVGYSRPLAAGTGGAVYSAPGWRGQTLLHPTRGLTHTMGEFPLRFTAVCSGFHSKSL